jgi:hypothetical protein
LEGLTAIIIHQFEINSSSNSYVISISYFTHDYQEK